MKSSIKFREEKSPLLRSKLPFKLGLLPLSSGVALGTKQELAVHLATGFSAGPIIKLAVKPHDPNPLSVILKAGFGLWGSPNDAPLTVTAEICFTPNGRDRAISLRIKPRVGDFSIRKDVRNVSLLPVQKKEAAVASVHSQSCENNEENQVVTPQKRENVLLIGSPLRSGDAKSLSKPIIHTGLDNVRSISVDSSNVVIGSTISSKIEGLEKGLNDWKAKREVPKGQDIDADGSGDGNKLIVRVDNDMLHNRKKVGSRRLAASFSLAGAQDVFRGCRAITHSIFPLGSQARLKVRWGIKSSADFFQGWDGSLPSVSFSKLPSLVLDKVTFEQVVPLREKSYTKTTGPPAPTTSLEQGLLPASFVEENRELAQVASMCLGMKRQLHLMHAENQVLRRAMEEMRSQVGSKGPWVLNGEGDGMHTTSSQSVPRLSQKSSFLDVSLPFQEGSHREVGLGKESSRRDTQAQKVQKVKPKKDEESQPKMKFPADDGMDVSKELERAILSAQGGSANGKKD